MKQLIKHYCQADYKAQSKLGPLCANKMVPGVSAGILCAQQKLFIASGFQENGG